MFFMTHTLFRDSSWFIRISYIKVIAVFPCSFQTISCVLYCKYGKDGNEKVELFSINKGIPQYFYIKLSYIVSKMLYQDI